jgi:hypothetical protein
MDIGAIGISARGALLALLLALAWTGSAFAQHAGQGRARGAPQKQPPQQQTAQRPVMPPSQGPRDAAYRRQQQQGQGGRMSDEERQQLRRDISDHGRDIYGERQGQQRR